MREINSIYINSLGASIQFKSSIYFNLFKYVGENFIIKNAIENDISSL